MADARLDWKAIDSEPRFQELHRTKMTFLWGLMIFSLIFYFLLPIGAAYFQDLYKVKVWGPINIGILFALLQFVVAWGIAFIYARRANAEFDPMAANREFIICMTDIGEYMIAPDLASVFASEAPGCSIRTRRIPQGRLREALELGEADLAVGTLAGANRSLRQQRLGEYVVTCMVSTQGRCS